jgi:hypothetical protein
VSEIEQLKGLREGLPGLSAEARASARADLLEHANASAPPPRRRFRRRRRSLALAGAAGFAAAAILFAIGTAGGPTARPEVASAAQLRHLAAVFPRLQIAGPWQILSTEGTGDEGRVSFRYEGEPGFSPAFEATAGVQIRWYSVPARQRESRLLAEGFTLAGRRSLEQSRPSSDSPLPFERHAIEVTAYVSGEQAEGEPATVGLWREGGRVYELHAQVPALKALWWIAERVEILREREWLLALEPGGGPYLAEVRSGVVKVEKVKIGEKPNGDPIYRTEGVIKGPGPGEKLEPPNLSKPAPPIVYREGDRVRVVVNPAPK